MMRRSRAACEPAGLLRTGNLSWAQPRMRLLLLWTIGLARRRPTHLAGASIGVGLAVALLACLGAFVDSSVKTMTHRAVAPLPIDWQILLNSPSNEGAV